MEIQSGGAALRPVSRWLAAVTAGAIGLAAGAPAAAYEGPRYYLSIGGLYTDPDASRGVEHGTGVSLGYAHRAWDKTWLEVSVFNSIFETGPQTSIDYYQSGGGIDVIRAFGNGDGNHFFGLIGAGVALNDVKPDDKDEAGGYANAGLGFRVNASENWGVRPRIELRYFHDTFDSGQGDLHLGLILEIPPRTERVVQKRIEKQKIVEVPVEVEKIVEKEIGCDIPGAVRPDAVAPAAPAPSAEPRTAPAPAPTAPVATPTAPPVPTETPPAPTETQPAPTETQPAPTAPAETQPATPAPASDSDSDGVPDERDRCPMTSAGASVGPNGCVLIE